MMEVSTKLVLVVGAERYRVTLNDKSQTRHGVTQSKVPLNSRLVLSLEIRSQDATIRGLEQN